MTETIPENSIGPISGQDLLPSLADYIFFYAKRFPERIALSSEYGDITYAELETRLKRLAVSLMQTGVKRGDRVAVLTTPRADAYTVFLALNCIGAIWLGINPAYQYPEMKYAIDDCRPCMLVFIDEFQGREYRADAERLVRESDSIEHLFCLNNAFDDIPSLQQLVAQYSDVSAACLPARHARDVAMIVYTSGSTGEPKGAMLPNLAMAYRGIFQYRHHRVRDYPRVYCPLPLNHVGGMQMVAAAALFNGGTVNFREKFDPAQVGAVFAKKKINFVVMFPTMYQLVLDHPAFKVEDFASLETINFSGGTISKELLMRLKQLGTGEVLTTFGSTESCVGAIYSEPNLDPDILAISVGKPQAGEARVVNKVGEICEVGEIGEFQVPKDYCMVGYYNRPEANTEVFTEDGWLRSGDLVEVLPDGNLRFSARISDMFKSGGYNIYPREIEIALEKHAEVVAAAVVGVPDPLYSEVGYAFILCSQDSKLTTELLREWAKEKLANYKVPKSFELVHGLPLLPNGKLDRVELKTMAKKAVSKK